jgi:hypothetical protein
MFRQIVFLKFENSRQIAKLQIPDPFVNVIDGFNSELIVL